MDIRKLQKLAVTALEDIKAKDIEVLNTSKLSALFDRVIIATGDSNRQVKALAKNVHDKVREAGGQVIGIEGVSAVMKVPHIMKNGDVDFSGFSDDEVRRLAQIRILDAD